MANDKPTATNNHRHQTTLRLTDKQYHQLQTMAGSGKMSNVLIKGLSTEWEFHQNVHSVIQNLPHFKTKEELAQWTAQQFKNSPELMVKYSNAMAISTYTKAIKAKHSAYQLLINEFDTTNYLIRTIGNNINQLARRANSGGNVDRNELAQFTQAVIKLGNIVDGIRKEVTS